MSSLLFFAVHLGAIMDNDNILRKSVFISKISSCFATTQHRRYIFDGVWNATQAVSPCRSVISLTRSVRNLLDPSV